MFKTIVLAFDGSEHARKAAAIVGDLAHRYDARVEIVHAGAEGPMPEEMRRLAETEGLVAPAHGGAHPSGVVAGPYGMLPLSELGSDRSAEVAAALADRLAETGAELVAAGGAQRVGRRVASGDPAEAILEAARDTGADLIVMGSRGLGRLGGLVLGSVSAKVAAAAECPVLTVK